MRLLIWGTQGVAIEIIAILSQLSHPYTEIGFLDDSPSPPAKMLGIPIVGSRALLDQCSPLDTHVYPAATSPMTRKTFAHYILARGFIIPSFIDPSANIRPEVKLGTGLLIQSHSLIQAYAHIGNYTLIAHQCVVGHHSEVGDYCNLYTGSRLLGYGQMAEGALLGSNACLMSFKRMGEWSKASICSAVLEDVPAFAKVQGNPAQIVKQYTGPPPAPHLWELKHST